MMYIQTPKNGLPYPLRTSSKTIHTRTAVRVVVHCVMFKFKKITNNDKAGPNEFTLQMFP